MVEQFAIEDADANRCRGTSTAGCGCARRCSPRRSCSSASRAATRRTPPYDELIKAPPDLYPLSATANRRKLAERVCRDIGEFVAGLDERGLEPNAPRPRPVARIVPRD